MSDSACEEIAIRELRPGEKLLWCGCPQQGILFRPADKLLIPVSICWTFCGYIWWFVDTHMPVPIGSPYLVLPWLIAGIYFMVGRFVADAAERKRSVYALTPLRALLFRVGATAKSQSIDLATMGNVALAERADGRGTIHFYSRAMSGAAMGAASKPCD